jgi:HK97 family phage prohead protease
MAKLQKHFSAFVSKADGEQGIVGAFTSVMGNIDYGDDIITNGAFVRTINGRREKIRVLDNHNSWSTMDAIGKILDIKEVGREALPQELIAKYPDATGALYVEIQFMLDDEISAGIFRRIKAGVIDEYSIGFEIIQQEIKMVTTDEGDRRIRFIKEIKLYEVSPVIFAMNDATMTVGAKADKQDKGDTEDGPMPTSGDEHCGNCKLYGLVTEDAGFCLHHKKATAATYKCDDYETNVKRIVREPMKESLAIWMQNQVAEFMELGALTEGDKDRIDTMLDTLSDAFMDMLPKDISEREIPVPQVYTAPKNLPQEEVPDAIPDSPEKALTIEAEAEKLLAQIKARMTI